MKLTRLQIEILLGLILMGRAQLVSNSDEPMYPEDEQHVADLDELLRVLREERQRQRVAGKARAEKVSNK